MLTPLSPTNCRLNSCLSHPQKPTKPSKKGKHVAFSKEGFPPSTGDTTDVAMAQAKQQAKRKGKLMAQKTPPRQEDEKIPVVGSSCTWRDAELDHLKVKVQRDVDVRELIPEKFWRFEHLKYLKNVLSLNLFDVLMVGKDELCALSEEDLTNEETVNLIRNPSRAIFQSLREIFSLQPEARKLNLSRKRKSVGSQSQLPPDDSHSPEPYPALNLPKSNQKSPGNCVL
jgi:hypothetical protein